MRERIIMFLKTHPFVIRKIWDVARVLLGNSIKIIKQENSILFCSFGGRGYNDSPKAIYNEILKRKEFNDWTLIWAFAAPEKFDIPRGKKIKIDTIGFLKALIKSKVWISNSGMDRGIDLVTDKIIRVETWHGEPIKKIGGEENKKSFDIRPEEYHGPIDTSCIRCAQSDFDKDIFSRVFHAAKDSFLKSDLPRNDELLTYTQEKRKNIREKINIPQDKQVILYTPTYREYLINDKNQTYIKPPIDLKKWQKILGEHYVLLIRAHYAVASALAIEDNDFVKDVSSFNSLNDLYAISDMMISDYSSTFFDFSILDKPMFCFAYDLEEYEKNRGLYLDIKKELPCHVHYNEDSLLDDICTCNIEDASKKTNAFHMKYAPYAGNASKAVVDAIINKLKDEN